jgi:uncharacterized membrane protein YgcG
VKCKSCGKNMRYSRGNGECVNCEDGSVVSDVLDVAGDIALGYAIGAVLSDDVVGGLSDSLSDVFSGGGGDFGGGGADGSW